MQAIKHDEFTLPYIDWGSLPLSCHAREFEMLFTVLMFGAQRKGNVNDEI